MPKNVLATDTKPLEELKPHHKYGANEKFSANELHALKTVSFDEIRVETITPEIPNIAKNAAVVEPKKPIINWEPTPLCDSSKLMNQYLMLSKIRLTSKFSQKHADDKSINLLCNISALVVITTMVGYAMAPAPFDPSTFLYCTVGTGLCSAAANAVNQYHEVPFDAQMARTKNRVLVRGQLTPLHSINFAIASAAIGTGLLYFGVNGYAAALGAGNLFLYTSVYTPMKRFSILNTWVGSVGKCIP